MYETDQNVDNHAVYDQNMASTGKKAPTLNSEFNYATFGQWRLDMGAFLSRNDMFAWSSLKAEVMPDEYPTGIPTDDTRDDNPAYQRMKAFGIKSEYEFTTNSEKAWGHLSFSLRLQGWE